MKIKIAIDNDRSLIAVVSQTVRHLCVVSDYGDHPSLNKIELAVVELLTNIFDHGNLDTKSKINVHCQFADDVFTVDVTDDGRALSASQASIYTDDVVRMPELGFGIDSLPVDGWGIQLIKSACDSISYERKGQYNNYTLAFDLAMAVS